MRAAFAAAAILVLVPCSALAQSASPATAPPPTVTLPQVEVIGTSPLLGSGIDPDKMPSNVQSLDSGDIESTTKPSLTNALERRKSSINLNYEEGNQFQPDVTYRGFEASPIFGTPQGLAVYQNGVRINEAFGDTVNWDLVPDFAINRTNIISGDPAFGLNALGGAIALEMKNGFNSPGGTAQIEGGSFGRVDGSAEYGFHKGDFGAYIGASGLYDGGFRQDSTTTLKKLYSDVGTERDQTSLHLSFGAASNDIDAPGPTPVELLNLDRTAIFTTPQSQHNEDEFLTLSGSYRAKDELRFDGNFYFRHFHQTLIDGNTTDVQACDDPTFLCLSDPTTLLFDTRGMPVPNFLGDETPGEIDHTETDTNGLGGSVQSTLTTPVFGHGNHFVFGASIDYGDTNYNARSELGIIEPNLFVAGNGIVIDQPDGTLAPIDLDATNTYYGIYGTDTFDMTDRLAFTVSGRYNLAYIDLQDLGGTSPSLTGNHEYNRFNPAAGATYKITSNITGYAGYSEANRIPTAGELACSDPAHPCALASFFVADPNLQQVVARSVEVGVRGHFGLDAPQLPRGQVNWNFGLFRTNSQDDILNIASPLVSGLGFFQNAGDTRRQGIEAGISFKSNRWTAYAQYSLVDATFQSTILIGSPNNPFADENGNIVVHPGDQLPAIPENRFQLGLGYRVTDKWTVGGDMQVVGQQYYVGDESNQNPKIPAYVVVNLQTTYDINDHFQLYGLIDNLFNEKYATFGILTDTGEITPTLTLTNPESQSPGVPFSGFVGVRAFF